MSLAISSVSPVKFARKKKRVHQKRVVLRLIVWEQLIWNQKNNILLVLNDLSFWLFALSDLSRKVSVGDRLIQNQCEPLSTWLLWAVPCCPLKHFQEACSAWLPLSPYVFCSPENWCHHDATGTRVLTTCTVKPSCHPTTLLGLPVTGKGVQKHTKGPLCLMLFLK